MNLTPEIRKKLSDVFKARHPQDLLCPQQGGGGFTLQGQGSWLIVFIWTQQIK